MSFIQQLKFLLFKLTGYHTHLLILWSLSLFISINLPYIETVAYCQQDTQIENISTTKVENQDSSSYFYLNIVLLLAFSVLLGYHFFNHIETLAQQTEKQALIIAHLTEEKAFLLEDLDRINPKQ